VTTSGATSARNINSNKKGEQREELLRALNARRTSFSNEKRTIPRNKSTAPTLDADRPSPPLQRSFLIRASSGGSTSIYLANHCISIALTKVIASFHGRGDGSLYAIGVVPCLPPDVHNGLGTSTSDNQLSRRRMVKLGTLDDERRRI
jgi:hypothetical protein